MQPLVKGKTQAYTFLLPILYGNKEIQKLTNNYTDIHNVYIDDNYSIQLVNKSNKAIYSLKFDVNYIEQYKLFTQGRYSKFSPYFKLLILKFWNGDSLLQSILFKGIIARQWWKDNYNIDMTTWSEDIEYWPKPNLKIERIRYGT